MIKRFFVNFVTSVGVNIFVVISSAIISIILARYLGPEDYGEYISALAAGALLAAVTNLGLNKIILREVIDESQKSLKALGGIILAKLVQIIAGLILTFIIYYIRLLFPKLEISEFIIWASLGAIIANTVDFFRTTMWSRDRVDLSNVLRFIEQAILVTFVFTITLRGASLVIIMIGLFIVSLVILIMTWITWFRLFLPPIFDSETRCIAYHLTLQALPIGIWAFITALYFRISILILAAIRPSTEVGWYSISYTVIQLIISLALIFTSLVMPILSRELNNTINFNNLYRRATIALIISGFSIAFLISSIGPEVTTFIYGSNFIKSGSSLRLFSFAVPVLFWVQILTTSLMVLGSQNYLIQISIFNLIATIILNFVLIPIWGFIGATIATTLAETSGLFLHLFFLRKIPNSAPLPKGLSTVLTFGFITLGIIYIFPEWDILFALSGIAILIVVSLFCNFIDNTDKILLRGIFF